jgi:hypothetical protein
LFGAAENFGICQQKQLKLTALIIQPRSEDFGFAPAKATQVTCFLFCQKFWNLSHRTMFCGAVKIFGIANKSTVFCSAAVERFRTYQQK